MQGKSYIGLWSDHSDAVQPRQNFPGLPAPLPPSSYYVMSYFLSLTPVDCIESRGTMERIINPFQRLAYLLYPVHHNPANSNACTRTTIPSFLSPPPPTPLLKAEISFYFLSKNSFVALHLVVKAVKGIPLGFSTKVTTIHIQILQNDLYTLS